jgi:hypothetical protein
MNQPTQQPAARFYGVSHGNGNDGVSHLHPDFIVKTDQPWRLARIALASVFKDRKWALEAAEIDGEAEFTIAACIHEGPKGETEFGAAYHITEVFPVSEDDRERARCPIYDSLADAFSAEDLEAVPAEPGEDFTAEELAKRNAQP